MLQSLLSQLDIVSLWEQFTSFAWSVIISWGVVIAFGVVVAIVVIRKIARDRDPTPYLIGEYDFNMTHIGEVFTGRVFALHADRDRQKIVTTFLDLTGDPKLAATFEVNVPKSHFYIVKYSNLEGKTRKGGMALMVTNGPLEHSIYHKELDIAPNFLRGVHISKRTIHDCEDYGFFRQDADEYDGQRCDYIYYPLKPITDDGTHTPSKLDPVTAQVLLSGIANARQMTITLEKSKYNELIADAANKRGDFAEGQVKTLQDKLNYVQRQWSKKDYYASQLRTLGAPVSLAMMLLIVGGCAMFLPDPLARFMPGYTVQHYIGFAVAIGAGILWLISRFMNPRIEG